MIAPPSIRRTLLIRAGVGVGALLCLLSGGIYLLVEKSLYGELDESISQTASLLSNQVELEDGRINYEWREGMGTNRVLVEQSLFQFWSDATDITERSPALGRHDLPKFSGTNGAPLRRNIILSDGHRARAVGLRIRPFVLPAEIKAMEERGEVIDPASLPQTLVVARDAEHTLRSLSRLRWILVVGNILTMTIGVILIDRAIRSSISPIGQLSAQVQRRTTRELDEPLDLPEDLPSELTGLATHFNLLLTRVAKVRQREKDFIRHAAHELRTPIAALQATTDLALSQPREAHAYAAHLASCQKTAQQLGELVARLSALARIGNTPAPATLSLIDLRPLLEECSQAFTPVAASRNLRIGEIPTGDWRALADPGLLRIILNNLFDNAVSYSPPGSTIRIGYERTESQLLATLANPCEAHGLEPDRLFEPLFRAEASRHDSASHLGIGLTLSREAAHAMQGTLRATESSGEIRFTLILAAATV